ncbi:MAG: hypothetical protein ACKOC4_14555 [Planctomycetia bacterium]
MFRTTTNRLVTAAHEDFCANTAFRWDGCGNGCAAMPTITDRLNRQPGGLRKGIVGNGVMAFVASRCGPTVSRGPSSSTSTRRCSTAGTSPPFSTAVNKRAKEGGNPMRRILRPEAVGAARSSEKLPD